MITLFDTHCHTVDPAYLVRGSKSAAAPKVGVSWALADALLLSTHSADFDSTIEQARHLAVHYGLGVHPLMIQNPQAIEREIRLFEKALGESLADPLLAVVGEIGLDAYPGATALSLTDQVRLFEAMLAAARDAGLPVSIHSRKALPAVLASLKRIHVTGVLHAFAGSLEEAKQSLKLGMKLGFGPSLTYEGSKRIRAVFDALPEDAFVLETDAPYMLTQVARSAGRNEGTTGDLLEVLQAAAQVRGVSPQELADVSVRNARDIFAKS